MGEWTTDSILNGKIRVRQPRRGYRFSIDAVLLSHLAAPRPGDRILDLGTGCGIIPLVLAHRFPEARIRGIELQPALAAAAQENVRQNGLADRIDITEADLRTLTRLDAGGPFDLVVSNPPYRRRRSGRINPDAQKAIARHEIAARLADVMEASRRLLGRAGRLAVIYPAERASDLLVEMRGAGIEPKHLLAIHPRMDTEAKLVFVEGGRGAGPGLKIAPPLAIRSSDGTYTPQVAAMLEGETAG